MIEKGKTIGREISESYNSPGKKKITDFSRIVTKKMEGKIRFQEAYYECATKNMVGS